MNSWITENCHKGCIVDRRVLCPFENLRFPNINNSSSFCFLFLAHVFLLDEKDNDVLLKILKLDLHRVANSQEISRFG